MRLAKLYIILSTLLFTLVSCTLATLPIGFPYRVLRPISDQTKIQKLDYEESYYKPPMNPQDIEWIDKLLNATPKEKILLQTKYRQFMALKSKNNSEQILKDTLVKKDGKPDFNQFWIDWNRATSDQRALLLKKFRDLLKSEKQESKIFSIIDDGCGTAMELGAAHGCGTYSRGLLELNINTAESLKNQNEFAMSEEVYRTTLDHISQQSYSDMYHNAITGYKNLLIKAGHVKEANQLGIF